MRDGFGLELGGEIAVDLIGEHLLRARGERTCQRAAPRPDLDERVLGLWIDRANDLLDPRRLEKVLTESFPRALSDGRTQRPQRPRRYSFLTAHRSTQHLST